MKTKTKILMADDHPIFRRGLCSVIESYPEFEIIGEAENGQKVLELLETIEPDIVVLDIKMPVLDGVEAAKEIHLNFPKIKIVCLTMELNERILGNLKNSKIKGYVLKENAVPEIIICLKQVAAGRVFMSPEILELYMQSVENESIENERTALIAKLTPTETRIIELLAKSKTNNEIAEILFISPLTVSKHRSNMCVKLNLSGNHSLVRFALENKESILKNEIV